MSFKATGDAQSAADKADPSLPTEIIENTGTGSGAERPRDPEPETAAAAGSAPAAVPAQAEPAEPGERDQPAEQDVLAEPADPDEDTVPGELADAAEPGEMIEMSEPVELAEPVGEAEPGRRGHGLLLVAGFVLAAIAIIGAAVAVFASLTHGFKKPVEITYKKSPIFSLQTGDCINPHGQSATVVPCGTAHAAEVFATFALPAGKWPGDAAARAAASSGCSSRLSGYLNPQLAISLSSTYVYPNSVAWHTGTRTVICEVRATNGKLTGSVRGAAASLAG